MKGEQPVPLQAATFHRYEPAGNDASCRLTWPAALEDVIAVGAIGPHGPAWFSNHGEWVDACAPGVDIISEFPSFVAEGTETPPETPEKSKPIQIAANVKHNLESEVVKDFTSGWARWSGTSFAAPAVVGAFARHIGAQKGDQKTPVGDLYERARTDLIEDPALLRFPGYGTVINVA